MKIFSAHTVHVIHVALRDTLIVLLVLFAALFFWLKSGIHLDRLTFERYEVDGLYIKLDKKLTLTAKRIIIPKSKQRPNFDNIDRVLDRIKYLLTFFHYIELEKVDFKNNHYQVIYADNILYITSDDYEIAGNVWRKGKVLIADISLFYIKKENIDIVAKLNYDLQSDRLILAGEYDAYHIHGRFKVLKEDQNLSFILNSDSFGDLKTVIDTLPLDTAVNCWITKKIQAKRYRLYRLSGRGKVHGTVFEPDLSSLKGKALLEDATIAFKKDLDPVKARRILLDYREGTLGFTMKDATFKKRKIKVHTVKISHMKRGEIAKLDLDFSLYTKVDASVQQIFKAYHIAMPVLHRDNCSNIRIKLGILLQDHPKVEASAEAVLGSGNLYLQKFKLPVRGGTITYAGHIVTLKGVKIKAPWYEGILNGTVDTLSQKAKLRFNATKIEGGEGKIKRFVLSHKEIPFTLDYGNGIMVNIPEFKLRLDYRGRETVMTASDLSKIKPYLSHMKVDLDGGVLQIRTRDFSHYSFRGELYRKACFIYDNSLCYTKVPCFGTVGPKGIEFFAFGKRLHYRSSKEKITLERLNIDLEKFLDSGSRKGKRALKGNRDTPVVIEGKQSDIRYDKYTLVTDRYRVRIDTKGNIKARGNLGSDAVHFVKRGKHITIDALRIHDRMLHPLIHFDGLKKGRYSIRISGVPGTLMHGEILLEGGVMERFKAYDKTRNFIRNNRELSRLKESDFAEKGFMIKEGKILYRIIGTKVIFDSIYIRGKSATIVGKGTLDILTKKLDINMAVQTVRKLGKIVGSVPVLGYILMGEDNSVTFALKITGTLEDPKVETSAAKEILMLPFELIKRTLESPAHLLNTERQTKLPESIKKEKAKMPASGNLVTP